MFDVIFIELALSFIFAFGNSLLNIVSYPGNRYRILRNTDNRLCSIPLLIFIYDDSAIDDFITVLL